MEPQYQHTINGQSVLQADLNTMGEAAALADDRVFAELLRLTPYDGSTVARGILPFLYLASGGTGTIAPNGATGSVKVNPFRAIIGTRTAVATDAKKNWRDIRSAVAVGSTTLHQVASFAANSSGNARWDLVYAAVAVDANSSTVTRKVKDPATKVITGTSVVVTKVTTVSILVVTGTPSASPAWPAVPADSGGTYYIPIAYVRIPNGFGASSTVLDTDIGEVAPLAAGASDLQSANSHNKADVSCLTTAMIATWGSSGTRPNMFIPTTLTRGPSLLVAATMTTGGDSHTSGAVIDNSRDWRGRLCKWTAMFQAVNPFVWDDVSGAHTPDGIHGGTGVTVENMVSGIGSTMASYVCNFQVTTTPHRVWIDTNGSGFLTLSWDTGLSAIGKRVLIWLDFTSAFSNCNT